MPKRKRPANSEARAKKHNSAFIYFEDYSNQVGIDDLYVFEDDHRVSNSLVRKLSTRNVTEYEGFDEQLLDAGRTNRDDLFQKLLDSSPIENGSLLIGFKGHHAMVVFIFGSNSFLSDKEAFWHLSDYATVLVDRLCICHLCFADQDSEEYKVQWRHYPNLELGFFSRLFYVCDFEDVRLAELQAAALSSTPAFYSTFYSDCLEYCKMYAKNFIRMADINVNGIVVDRLNALAITGTRVEASSRQHTVLAVSANQSLASADSSHRSSTSLNSDIRTLTIVLFALMLFKFLEALLQKTIT
jgi:hypothetical protein